MDTGLLENEVSDRNSTAAEADGLSQSQKQSNAQKEEKEHSQRWHCCFEGCTASYQFKNDLKYHLKKKHPERKDLALLIAPDKSTKVGKKFPCPIDHCTSGFNWSRDLRRHLSIRHSGEGVYLQKKRRGRPLKTEEVSLPDISHEYALDASSDFIEKEEQGEVHTDDSIERLVLDGSFQMLPESFV